MSSAFTQEAIVDFLAARGGKVQNTDLIDHFKHVFPGDTASRASMRDTFKKCVDAVAFVKVESGGKWVCLKKRHRLGKVSARVATGPGRAMARDTVAPTEDGPSKSKDVGGPSRAKQPDGGDEVSPANGSGLDQSSGARRERTCETAASGTSPASGHGTDSDGKGSRLTSCHSLADESPEKPSEAFTRAEAADMGHSGSREAAKRVYDAGSCVQAPPAVRIPAVVVSEPLPLPDTAGGPVFALPGASGSGSGSGPAQSRDAAFVRPTPTGSDARRTEGGAVSPRLPGPPSEDEAPGVTVIDRSPQVRRSGASPASGDSDASSSRAEDEDAGAAPGASLDPLEHEWMLRCADGEWPRLRALLVGEPGLVLRRDFVTGFTCLHWAAKQGKPELLALLVEHAARRGVPVDVDARSGGGYTPLHLAAMHGHLEVLKLLLGAYGADAEARDHSGRRACQYLAPGTRGDIRDIAGGDAPEPAGGGGERCSSWRFSRVLGSGGARPGRGPPRRMASLGKLQRIQVRAAHIVHSSSFSGADELARPWGAPLRSRPKSNLLG